MNRLIVFESLYKEVKELLKIARQRTANGDYVEGLYLFDMAFGGVEYVKHLLPTSDVFLVSAIKCLEQIKKKLL